MTGFGGSFGGLFRSRRVRLGDARRDGLLVTAQGLLDKGLWQEARVLLEQELAEGGPHVSVLRALEICYRESGDLGMTAAVGRLADALDDPQRLFELGSLLLSAFRPRSAASVLEAALLRAPFDAVIRSEAALAFQYARRPDKALEMLALHPCLADDAGALFSFGWCSLLCCDVQAAQGALGGLLEEGDPERKPLALRLQGAIERMQTLGARPRTLAEWVFVEYGSVLLDESPEGRGRYVLLRADHRWFLRIANTVAALARSRCLDMDAEVRVSYADAAARSLAEACAEVLGGEVTPWEQGAALPGLLVASSPEGLLRQKGEWQRPGVVTLVALMPGTTPASITPDLIGAFADSAKWSGDSSAPRDVEAKVETDPEAFSVEWFLRLHGGPARLAEARTRTRGKFVHDAPM